MRRVLLFTVLGLVLAGGSGLFAAPGWSWSTSLDTIVGVGDTRYLMEIPGSPGISSELVFPLNSLLEGVTFQGVRSGGRHDGGHNWSLEASIAVNLLAPYGTMKDSDWDMYPGYPKIIWSYTESDPTMLWLAASAAWKPVVAAGSWGKLEAVLGYRLHYMSQKEYGINGWQYIDDDTDLDTDPDLWVVDDPRLALTYWVLWNVPTAGLAVTLKPGPRVAVALEAGLAIPYVADQDDHVLRYKLSTAHGLGLGGYADLSARYSWGKAQSRVHPYLSLAAGLLALKANTSQTQRWYGDDPSFDGDETGLVIRGVDHQISLRELHAQLAFGITF
jgi:hypothetical protein